MAVDQLTLVRSVESIDALSRPTSARTRATPSCADGLENRSAHAHGGVFGDAATGRAGGRTSAERAFPRQEVGRGLERGRQRSRHHGEAARQRVRPDGREARQGARRLPHRVLRRDPAVLDQHKIPHTPSRRTTSTPTRTSTSRTATRSSSIATTATRARLRARRTRAEAAVAADARRAQELGREPGRLHVHRGLGPDRRDRRALARQGLRHERRPIPAMIDESR